MVQESEQIITDLPTEFMSEFRDELEGRIPEEKVKVQLRQEQAARIAKQAGSLAVEGLGQKVATIDARLYFRMLHDHRDHGQGWLNDFLADNPELCCPGYKPKRNIYRHGKTFINGQAVT